MSRSVLKSSLCALSIVSVAALAGCSGLVGAVQHPEVVLIPEESFIGIALEEYEGRYQIVGQDSTMRAKGKVPAGRVFYFPDSEELQELLSK